MIKEPNNKNRTAANTKEYYRIKDLMAHYGCSRGHIANSVKAGLLPPPITELGIHLWPAKVIKAIDRQRDLEYYKTLQNQGFSVPEGLEK